MRKYNRRRLILAITLIGLFFISGCEKHELLSGEPGVLKGVISIGPLCPVETDPPDPGCLPTAETYKSYPVVVLTSDGKNKVAQLSPELDGSFCTELAAGSYLVVLENNQNRISRSNLPLMVSIKSDNDTLLNIDIDTGIR